MNTTDLMLLRSPVLGVPHAFTTRRGGVSAGAFASYEGAGLNLDDREDNPADVAENRRRVAEALGFGVEQVARLNQIHGVDVLEALSAGVQTADALVSCTPGLLLAIGTADCYPLLLADEDAGIVGAAHAGWKGTLGQIGARTVEAMTRLGATPGNIKAAIGPGICGARYGVSAEVAGQFRAAGMADAVIAVDGGEHLDLAGANRAGLLAAGLLPEHIWVSGRCSTEDDFYSYRRDSGRTGRMWAVIGLSTATGQNA
ncbi:peptidoglycan editing factor PgeF [Deinococcus puniceus]|uniref:Purine nucleoside phosphorylase n=1 Tax=Deinococcus puniceus TaxID=1182568 RepID=A0A172TCY0_9DEIO|nr:peptidoglycan editing factor PgeF [Deinococcus puniceus]ANE44653.1 laccase [Deinococcus puniceus]